jgi:hypothetical protein
MKSFTVYFYSKSRSCVLYFGIDGRSKARVLKMGREMAKSMMAYHKADNIRWRTKITVEVERYDAKTM